MCDPPCSTHCFYALYTLFLCTLHIWGIAIEQIYNKYGLSFSERDITNFTVHICECTMTKHYGALGVGFPEVSLLNTNIKIVAPIITSVFSIKKMINQSLQIRPMNVSPLWGVSWSLVNSEVMSDPISVRSVRASDISFWPPSLSAPATTT